MVAVGKGAQVDYDEACHVIALWRVLREVAFDAVEDPVLSHEEVYREGTCTGLVVVVGGQGALEIATEGVDNPCRNEVFRVVVVHAFRMAALDD